jgi:hypothetical protein
MIWQRMLDKGCHRSKLGSGTALCVANMRNYTFSEVLKFTGASRGELKHWTVNLQIIVPTVKRGTGTGNWSRFSFFNLVQVGIAVRMNRFSVPTAHMNAVLAWIEFLERARMCELPKWRRGVRSYEEAWAEVSRITRGSLRRRLEQARASGQDLLKTDDRFASAVDSWSLVAHRLFREKRGRQAYPLVYREDGQIALPIWDPPDLSGFGSAAVVLNLRRILEELEKLTGDEMPIAPR